MRVIRHVAEIGAPQGPRVVAEGSFDGIHRGHRQLLASLVERARACRGEAVVLVHRLEPGATRLTDLREQIERLGATGVAAMVLTDAGAAKAAMQRLAPATYVTASTAPAGPAGVVIETIAPVAVGGARITAAAIRAALAAADLDAARLLLGRDAGVAGRVVHGFHRGAPLGIPTANLRVRDLQLPPDGVYAVRAESGGRALRGVANIGFNPTFGNRTRSVETHLFDFSGDIYGTRLRIAFVARLRGEQKFSGIEALLEQIRADIAAARRVLDGDG